MQNTHDTTSPSLHKHDTHTTPRLPGLVAVDDLTLLRYDDIVAINAAHADQAVVVMRDNTRWLVDADIDTVIARLHAQLDL